MKGNQYLTKTLLLILLIIATATTTLASGIEIGTGVIYQPPNSNNTYTVTIDFTATSINITANALYINESIASQIQNVDINLTSTAGINYTYNTSFVISSGVFTIASCYVNTPEGDKSLDFNETSRVCKGSFIVNSTTANDLYSLSLPMAQDNYLRISSTFTNKVPTVSNVSLTQNTAYIGQTLTANWTFNETQGESDNSYYRWYVNGSLIEDGRYSENGTYPRFSNYSNVGDNITLSILANDGYENASSWINSSTYTVESFNATFTVNSLSYFNSTVAVSENLTFIVSIQHPYESNLSYNVTDNHNDSLISAVTYSTTDFNVTGTNETIFNITVTANITGSVTDDFNLTLTRTNDNHQITLPVSIYISSNATDISFEPINTWAASIYSDQSLTRILNVTNIGYPAYDCQFSVQTPLSEFFSSSSFDIGTNEEKNISIKIINPLQNLYTGTVTLSCANASVEHVSYTDETGITYLLAVSQELINDPNDGRVGGGGGGGSGSQTTINNIIIESNVTKPICSIQVSPSSILLENYDDLIEIRIENNDEVSYTPDFRFIDIKGNITKDFEITNTLGSVLPGKSISFGIKYNPLNGFIDGKAVITLESQNCADINITVETTSINKSESFIDFLLGTRHNRIIEIAVEPMMPEGNIVREKVPYFNIGLTFAFVFLLWIGLLAKEFYLSWKERDYVKISLLVVFHLIATSITVLIFGIVLRMIF